jgi:hypothetical protein
MRRWLANVPDLAVRTMKHTHGLAIPTTLQDACHPQRMALLVYDMQVGICSQVKTANFVRSYITVCAKLRPSANGPSILAVIQTWSLLPLR